LLDDFGESFAESTHCECGWAVCAGLFVGTASQPVAVVANRSLTRDFFDHASCLDEELLLFLAAPAV
jgi:hypothetical protein